MSVLKLNVLRALKTRFITRVVFNLHFTGTFEGTGTEVINRCYMYVPVYRPEDVRDGSILHDAKGKSAVVYIFRENIKVYRQRSWPRIFYACVLTDRTTASTAMVRARMALLRGLVRPLYGLTVVPSTRRW